jgi:predicted enzyme related to lactoylglutathione lyase
LRRATVASHPIVHVEFASTDPQRAGRFYADLFGWHLDHDPTFDYLMFRGDGGPGGGFVGAGTGGLAAGDALVHVGTDDLDATLRRVEELGGAVEVPKTEIPGVGWFGIVRDPADGRVAVFQAQQP